MGCNFCSQEETLEHLFLQCARLRALFSLLDNWFLGLGEIFLPEVFIYGPKYAVKKKRVHVLMNFISGAAKLAIWITRKNQTRGAGSVDPVQATQGLVAARLRVEHAYYRTVDNLETFNATWAVGGVLCMVGERGELILSF